MARVLSMFCILAVFVPSFFMIGASRQLFVPLSLAVAFSMIASYVLSSTLVPVLSIWIVRAHAREEAATAARTHSAFARFQSHYANFLRRLVAARWLVAGAYLVVSVGVVWFFGSRLGV